MSVGSAPQDLSLAATWPDITPSDSTHYEFQRLTYTEVVSLCAILALLQTPVETSAGTTGRPIMVRRPSNLQDPIEQPSD